MSIETRLIAMEERMAALEAENAQLKQAAAVESETQEELTPLQVFRIKELARDTMRYGYDAAMKMHGRTTARDLSRQRTKAA
jgi:hypothetical protein